jgi:hypothetical protein
MAAQTGELFTAPATLVEAVIDLQGETYSAPTTLAEATVDLQAELFVPTGPP